MTKSNTLDITSLRQHSNVNSTISKTIHDEQHNFQQVMPSRHNQAAIGILLNIKNKYPVNVMGKKEKELIQNRVHNYLNS